MNNIDVIGITGAAQAGKDTVAEYLVKNYGYIRYAFADKLKQFLLAQDPWFPAMLPEEGPYGEVFNGTFVRLSAAVRDHKWESVKRNLEVARLLQVTGTEAGRAVLGDDVWVRQVKQDAQRVLSHGGRVVFSDVSFQNEADLVDSLGGTMIRITRPGYESGRDPNHPSEYNRREGLEVALTLNNTGTIPALLGMVQIELELDELGANILPGRPT